MPSNPAAITNLVEVLERISDATDPPLKNLVESCLRSVGSSARRIDIGGARLTRAALDSVCAAATFPVWTYLTCAERTEVLDGEFRRLFRVSAAMADALAVRRPADGAPDLPAPAGWQEVASGSFRSDVGGHAGEILYSPHMPGGDWAAWLSGLPVLRSGSPDDAANGLKRLAAFLDNAHQEPRPLQRFGKR